MNQLRLSGWTGQKFGSAEKTQESEEFKQLEQDTETRLDNIEQISNSLSKYLKTFEKKKLNKLDINKTQYPINALSQSLMRHEKFLGDESNYGKAINFVGESFEKIFVLQCEMLAKSKSEYSRTLELLLVDLKEYQHLKKKLKNRRLDYDARLAKVQKSKKEKPELEEEMKQAQSKYERTLTDLLNLMSSFNDKEENMRVELNLFIQAQLEFHQKSTLILTESMAFLSDTLPKMEKKIISFDTASEKSVSLTRSFSSHSILGQSQTETAERKVVKVVFDFTAENSNELSIKVGEQIQVVEEIDPGWWIGKNQLRQVGMFPSNYVTLDQMLPPLKSSRSTLGKESIEAKDPVDNTDVIKEPANTVNVKEAVKKDGESKSRQHTPSPVVFKNITEKLTKEELKKTSNIDLKAAASKTPPPYALATAQFQEKASSSNVAKCKECDCVEFSLNVFKKGSCNNCFHKHEQ